ncbi:DUF499 domain-containing protein [Thiohalocapsa sp. ML1]|jgi:hypothetical protein|uniref:DUF499 domain-containing protein n=1 Tax=Thiohalocapsa sp. ML1 TaxID=1431688 RepID=UPI0007323F55|nr:DUF499 domain-containing protein [Thiohalocapsa sp. ML1]
MDELMNYSSRSRKSGLSAQLYDFLHNLSETARGQPGVVLVVSIPASELEMTAEDQSDYDRFKKMLDRLGKPVVMSAEAETSEIIRRRLFEWDLRAVSQDGRVLLSKDALAACNEHADWLLEHRQLIPAWFPVDDARKQFADTYPFHPVVLSVFERKWQTLPRFQQTRGVPRLLAQWVSNAYQQGYRGAHRDGLIGTAPLDDPLLRRSAVPPYSVRAAWRGSPGRCHKAPARAEPQEIGTRPARGRLAHLQEHRAPGARQRDPHH